MKLITSLFLFLILSACSPKSEGIFSKDESEETTQEDWLIPSDEVIDGGPGKDGIPSIDQPKFINPSEEGLLNDDELVIAVASGNKIKVYPHRILDWHEIVNDKIGDFAFALTYCPLTGTGINWNRAPNGVETTYGVSGLLYNSNLIPYDRKTDSNWSQIRLECVNGLLKGSKVETRAVFEGTWGFVKQLEGVEVLSTETGFSRNYESYPYGDYRTNHNNIIFPVSRTDDRKQAKDRVLGVIENGVPKIYGFEDFGSSSTTLLNDLHHGKDLLIIGDKTNKYITAFYPKANRSYVIDLSESPYILKDDEGKLYDIFGRSKSSDVSLGQPEQFMGYWFSWPAFYPELELYAF